MLWAAAIEAGIPKERVQDVSLTPDPEDSDQETEGVAVPEESAPGESQSNGAAERAVQMVEDQIRTMKLALEHNLQVKVKVQKPGFDLRSAAAGARGPGRLRAPGPGPGGPWG